MQKKYSRAGGLAVDKPKAFGYGGGVMNDKMNEAIANRKAAQARFESATSRKAKKEAMADYEFWDNKVEFYHVEQKRQSARY
jgi:hypothetical protein